jgi:hypothetical protein
MRNTDLEVCERLDLDQLARVTGGMRLDDLPMSTNIEDRRGLSRRESMRVRSRPAPPLPPLHRTPGDLPSQLGLDDIHVPHRRHRR